MKEYTVKKSRKMQFLEKKTPVIKVKGKSLLKLQIAACTNGYSLVGPVYIEGAKKGNVLKITVKKIEIGKKGFCAGLIIPVRDNKVLLQKNIELSAAPNIGVVGVAPAEGKVSAGKPGRYGGNMDTNDVKEGSILYLPVQVEGAYLYAGDVHGVMGDGEVWGQGLEISASVELFVEIESKPAVNQPYVVRDGKLAIIATGDTYDEAVKSCINETTDFLCNNTELGYAEVKAVMSLAGSLEFCQVVNPAKTVRFDLPLSILKEVLNEYTF